MSVLSSAASRSSRAQVIADVVRQIAVMGVAGLIVGIVVGGLGSRLFMRVAGAVTPAAVQGATTEAGARIGEITVGGTLALVVFVGIPAGVIGAALAVITFPWLAWGGRWRGVAFGVTLFALASATSDVMNPDNIDFLLIRNGWLMVAAILALFLGFGIAMHHAVDRLDGRMPAATDAGRGVRALYATIAATGVLLAGLLGPLALFTSSLCRCEPPVAASVAAAVAGVGTVLHWVARWQGASSIAARLAPVFGFGGVAGILVFGLLRAVADAKEIVLR